MQERITEIRTIIDRNGNTLIQLRTDIDAWAKKIITLQDCDGHDLQTGDTVATCAALQQTIRDVDSRLQALHLPTDCNGGVLTSAPSCAQFNALGDRVTAIDSRINQINQTLDSMGGRGGGVSQSDIDAINRTLRGINEDIAAIRSRLDALEGRVPDDDDKQGGTLGFGWGDGRYQFSGWSVSGEEERDEGQAAPRNMVIRVSGPSNAVFALEGIDGSMHATPRAPGVPLVIRKAYVLSQISAQTGGVLYVVHGGKRVAGWIFAPNQGGTIQLD